MYYQFSVVVIVVLVVCGNDLFVSSKFVDRFNYLLHPTRYHQRSAAPAQMSLLEVKPVIDKKLIVHDEGITPEKQAELDAKEEAVLPSERVTPRVVKHLENSEEEEKDCKGCHTSLHESLKKFSDMTPEELRLYESAHGPSPIAPDAHLSSDIIDVHLPVVPRVVEDLHQ